ncbi:MAG TPA: Crp/Fnr family transcriptional regulator [Candidatus Binatia bacterium]|nr:Crp/Fnr family transcriptional regulator [Candidatus Binatia bacterium]
MGQAAVLGTVFPSADRAIRNLSSTTATQERAGTKGFNSILKRRMDAVQGFEAFSEIPGTECAAIVADAQEIQFPRHSTIFSEGSPATHAALLLSGCIKLTQGEPGQEVILRLNGPGDLMGKIGNHTRANHLYTTHAVQASAALVWETDAFEALMVRFPFLRRNIASILERHLNELEIRYREVSTEKVSSRLSNLLVRLVNQVGRRIDSCVEIALSRRELAQLTGTTLFTVSRLLCQWEAQGAVSARREVVLVHDVRALTELSHEE